MSVFTDDDVFVLDILATFYNRYTFQEFEKDARGLVDEKLTDLKENRSKADIRRFYRLIHKKKGDDPITAIIRALFMPIKYDGFVVMTSKYESPIERKNKTYKYKGIQTLVCDPTDTLAELDENLLCEIDNDKDFPVLNEKERTSIYNTNGHRPITLLRKAISMCTFDSSLMNVSKKSEDECSVTLDLDIYF